MPARVRFFEGDDDEEEPVNVIGSIASLGSSSLDDTYRKDDDDEPTALMAVLAKSEADLGLDEAVDVVAIAPVSWHGRPRRLHVVRGSGAGDESPHGPLSHLFRELEARESIGRADEGPWAWPMHTATQAAPASAAIAGEDVDEGLEDLTRTERCQRHLKWFASILGILGARDDAAPKRIVGDRYGSMTSFLFEWGDFYVQKLWLCWIWCTFWPLLTTWLFPEYERAAWEILKVGLWLWGLQLALSAWRRFMSGGPQQRLTRRRSTMRPGFEDVDQSALGSGHWGRIILIATPVVVLFAFLVFFVLTTQTKIMLQLIFIWGDCLNLPPPCQDPQTKHGFYGWLAMVCCDVSLAICFEVFFALGGLLAEWVASLRNYRYVSDHKVLVGLLRLALDAFEKIGFMSVIAFSFVPQWEDPSSHIRESHARVACDLDAGHSIFQCLQLNLPLERRQWVFRRLLRGPFVVAPFIRILMHVIVPFVVWQLHKFVEHRRKTHCRCFGRTLRPTILRIAGIIFAYDAEHTGFWLFLKEGYPYSFSPSAAVMLQTSSPPASGPDQVVFTKTMVDRVGSPSLSGGKGDPKLLVEEAISQGILKDFDPEAALLELKLNFLWVLFFAPIMPEGILPTLLASVLRHKLRLVELLHMKKPPNFEHDKAARRLQCIFIVMVVSGNIAWTSALSLITYNSDLWQHLQRGEFTFLAVLIWYGISIGLGFAYNEYHRRQLRPASSRLFRWLGTCEHLLTNHSP